MNATANVTTAFMSAIFGDQQHRAHVTGTTIDPSKKAAPGKDGKIEKGRMWGGALFENAQHLLTPDANQYACQSLSKDGSRKAAQLDYSCAILVDDIGIKVEWDALKLEPFTALVETSPGNWQGWYGLKREDPDTRNRGLVEFVIDSMIKQGLTSDLKDPGMRGAMRYGRIPAGVNNKAAVVKAQRGQPWKVRADYIRDDVHYTLAEVAAAYDIDLEGERERLERVKNQRAVLKITAPKDKVEEYIYQMRDGLEKHGCEPRDSHKDLAIDVRCPWASEHTADDDTGSMLFLPNAVDSEGTVYPHGGYKCFHGHCEKRNIYSVSNWLRERGVDIPPPSVLTIPPLPELKLGDDTDDVDPLLDIRGKRNYEEILRAHPPLLEFSEATGKPKRGVKNLAAILKHDNFFASDQFRLSWDRFTSRTYVRWRNEDMDKSFPGKGVPEEMVELMKLDLATVYGVEFSDMSLRGQLGLVLMRNTFDSALEWATAISKQWDGVKRIDSWLIEFAGAKDNPYVRRVSELFMMAVAKRALSPDGFKFDYLIILEGAQGIGKSTMLETLSPKAEWYTSVGSDVSKLAEVVSQRLGKMVAEMPELQSIKRSDYNEVKKFLSNPIDRTRLSYEKRAADYPRRCGYIGTTNDSSYLMDSTGNRRFWPVALHAKRIDRDGLHLVRDQLWAEACAKAIATDDVKDYTLDDELESYAAAEAEERHEIREDVWYDILPPKAFEMFEEKGHVLMGPLLNQIGIETMDQDLGRQRRAGRVLKASGYVRERKMIDGKQCRCWVPVELAVNAV